MKKILQPKQDQSGAVAMITVILLMFIFLLVTLGFLRMSISEQRNAIDTDLNSRAYYAAESGIEDAKRIIARFYADGRLSAAETGFLNGDDCAPATPEDGSTIPWAAELDTEITCQLIDFESSDFVATLKVNQSVFLPLIPATGPASSVASVRIEWHDPDPAVDGAAVPRPRFYNNLPTVDCWNSNESIAGCAGGTQYPAMLRAGLFGHPSGAVNRGNINNRISYLGPVTNGSGTVAIGNFEPKDGVSPAQTNRFIKDPSCTAAASGYLCSLTITGLTEVNYLRLTAIYDGTDIRVTMFDTNGDALDFERAQAKIDVTARAGDAFRRIETRIPLRSLDILPDEAVTTAEQLCKLITIRDPNTALDECP